MNPKMIDADKLEEAIQTAEERDNPVITAQGILEIIECCLVVPTRASRHCKCGAKKAKFCTCKPVCNGCELNKGDDENYYHKPDCKVVEPACEHEEQNEFICTCTEAIMCPCHIGIGGSDVPCNGCSKPESNDYIQIDKDGRLYAPAWLHVTPDMLKEARERLQPDKPEDCPCKACKVSQPEERITPEEAINILTEISAKSGYDFHFTDVDIDITGNKILIVGNKKLLPQPGYQLLKGRPGGETLYPPCSACNGTGVSKKETTEYMDGDKELRDIL